jgi:hypothetical protein
MLLIYGNQELWSSFTQEEFAESIRATEALHKELRESGEFVGSYGSVELRPIMHESAPEV